MEEPINESSKDALKVSGNDSNREFGLVEKEKQAKNSLSPFQIYQLAIPHIIESNLRVQKLKSMELKKLRKAHLEKLFKFLDKRNDLNVQLRRPGEGITAFERYEAAKDLMFKERLYKKLKSSVGRRKKIVKLQKEIEKLSADIENESSSRNKKKRTEAERDEDEKQVKKSKKSSTKRTLEIGQSGDGSSSSTLGEVQEEDGVISVAGLPEDEARSVLWKHIARKQIPKLARSVHQGTSARLFNSKKLAQAASGLIKRQNSRLTGKPVLAARRAMKEMLAFWKKNEREEREMRKRAEKEAAERRRIEEEQREARRQAKKLNFLITQTELYSHFVGRKQQQQSESHQQQQPEQPSLSKETDFADVDDSIIQAEAERIAKNAAAAHQAKLQEFQTNSTNADLDFMNPSTLKDAAILEQPSLMQVTLKSYQLKGLTWLASLYEQGINGILADEMGLGKTIQSISLLAHLAERQNNWGPFLIVTPASTLHNWQQEFARFVPALKIIPYWGSVQDRKVLRSTCMPFWTGKKVVNRDTPFHVMITSYQLIVSDEQYLQKVKWQYMILDEAQAIKSSSSIRWKTLLGFSCRNRLLLTGTPIQNSMQELWALLHFIMPTLFDSHDEFSEWFSKDIESHAENRGSGLNSHQLHRLHMILKPFMLRRVKSDVENEMGEKVEKDIFCELSPRQKRLYRGIKDKLPVLELLSNSISTTTNISGKFNFGFGIGGDSTTTTTTTTTSSTITTSSATPSTMFTGNSSVLDSALMNLVMQFRKVCNHPELLERTEIKSPLNFTSPERLTLSPSSNASNSNTILFTTPPAIELRLPKRIIEEIPLGSKRILLEVSNSLSGRFENELSPFEGLLREPCEIELPCKESLRFIEERLPLAAGIKVISKGPQMGNSNFNGRSEIEVIISELDSTRLDRSVTIPSMEKFIRDCGKLSRLDSLLKELKAGDHRVLIYNQMTRMIDLMEEYLQFRGYSYLRLDGSTNIATRRDLVHSWQTDPTIFVFLLSTRAGGLGINLTAADTVIFYDSDWNPTVDKQAMDRAHRLGQTKQVTVYRMITKNTVEERIMQRAKQKDEIHKVVIAGGAFKDDDSRIESSSSNDTSDIVTNSVTSSIVTSSVTNSVTDSKPKDRKEIMSLLLVDEE